jgi:hypothetical protein
VARFLEGFATVSSEQLSLAKQTIADPADPSFRRMVTDVRVQHGLGMFFAQKLRAAVAFELYEKKDDLDCLRDAVYFYRAARSAWEGIIQHTENVYVSELGFGRFPHIRGHWKDRLPAIDEDVKEMEQLLREETGGSASLPKALSSSSGDWLITRPPIPSCEHAVPVGFNPGEPLDLVLTSSSPRIQTVRLHYRHVNQVEVYRIEPMSGKDGIWHYEIPGDFLDSDYPLMYFFELVDNEGHAWIYPGFDHDLANQPYFHLQRTR